MLGTLYGIGVGPGDPELLTLKAVKVLKEVSHVFAASSSKNDYSLARSIVNGHLPAGTPVDQLAFPMTYNPERLENARGGECLQQQSEKIRPTEVLPVERTHELGARFQHSYSARKGLFGLAHDDLA